MVTLLVGCNEDDASTFPFDPSALHGPLAITVLPGTTLALVVSTNFDFSNSANDPKAPGGAIHPVDLTTNQLITTEAVQIPNFAGQIAVDPGQNRLFLADRDNDEVRVYSYLVPGADGSPIDISFELAFDVGDDPFGMLIATPANFPIRKLFVGNILTSDLSVVDAETLSVFDLNPDDGDREALRLNDIAVGSLNLSGQAVRPNRMVPFGIDELFLMSTSTSGLLFVIDAKDNGLEAVVNLRSLAGSPILNGMAVTPTRSVFVASQGAEGLLLLDLSGIRDNGVDNEVVPVPLIQFIPTGSSIEDVKISADNTKIYAASFSRNSVLVLNAVNGFFITEIGVGQGPTELALNNAGTQLLVTNFLSDSISVINTATDTVSATIR